MQENTLLTKPISTVVSGVLDIGIKSQPFSPESIEKAPRIRDAKLYHSVCPYCAVGCSQNVYVKNGEVLDIEGNPESPINHGTLCPKGAATFQYLVNPSRITQVLYRAPYSDHWEVKPLDWRWSGLLSALRRHVMRRLYPTCLTDAR